jgi:integrase
MILKELADTVLRTKNIRSTTLKNYYGALNRNIYPLYGQKPIEKIDKFELVRTLSVLPPQTAYQTLMALKSVFSSALEQGLVDENLVAGVKSPRIQVQMGKFMTWDYMKTQTFGPYDSQIKFLALHGARWSEAVVLTESDIRDGFVTINKSIHGSTKTASGNRRVPYLGYFKPFPKSRHALNRYLDKHGVNIHSLRKTYAYILKRNGIHVTTAQKLMGHASPMVTMRIYTAVLSEEIVEAGETLKKKLSLEL